VVLLDQHWGLDVVSGFPCVITIGVSHPLYEILQLFLSSVTSVITNGLDLVLLIITNQVRGQLGIVCSVFGHLLVRSQQRSMEHGVYGPLEGELQLIRNW